MIDSFADLDIFDTNGDGLLNSADAKWSQLEVWEAGGTADVPVGLLVGLDKLGITSIGLTATNVDKRDNGNIILRGATFTWSDGSPGNIAEVNLQSDGSALFADVSAEGPFAHPQGAANTMEPASIPAMGWSNGTSAAFDAPSTSSFATIVPWLDPMLAAATAQVAPNSMAAQLDMIDRAA